LLARQSPPIWLFDKDCAGALVCAKAGTVSKIAARQPRAILFIEILLVRPCRAALMLNGLIAIWLLARKDFVRSCEQAGPSRGLLLKLSGSSSRQSGRHVGCQAGVALQVIRLGFASRNGTSHADCRKIRGFLQVLALYALAQLCKVRREPHRWQKPFVSGSRSNKQDQRNKKRGTGQWHPSFSLFRVHCWQALSC
jgi:hypothetical protein